MPKLISIIIPVYNEEKNISLIYLEIKSVLEKLKEKYNFEIIFVDDGSQDKTEKEILKVASLPRREPEVFLRGRQLPVASFLKVKLISLSRNFGKEIAITAGLNNCQGEAVITIDADLQHPPNLIPEFIKLWERGTEVVIGIRKTTEGEGFVKKLGGRIFYRVIDRISETKIIPNATDFRLLDRKVVNIFNEFTEKNRMVRGLIDWLGFKREYVYFDAPQREGKPTYTFSKLLNLALTGFVSFSLLPLKIAGYLGIFITFISGILGLFVFFEKYILNDPLNLAISGTAALAIMLLFFVGIILICIGLLALYIAQIYQEVQNRPLYVIRRKKL